MKPASLASSADALGRVGRILADIVLPFALVLYLALMGGGYDSIVYSEVGIMAWWLLMVASIAGTLPATRITRGAWLAAGLFVAFLAWTALGVSWSESSERSVAEVARVASYVGVFALAVAAQGRDTLRRTIASLGAAIAVVAILALLQRFQPNWFPASETFEFIPDARARLSYPLGYWNALAGLLALGMPLLVWASVSARSMIARALATAALPALALAAFFTLSRGGAFAILAGLATLFALYPRRLALLPILAIAAVSSAALIAAANAREALTDALGNEAARTQGDSMMLITIAVCVAAGLLAVATIRIERRYGSLSKIAIPRRSAWIATGVAALLVFVGALAAGAPADLSDRFQEFKQPTNPGGSAARFESASGNGRWQYWGSAVDANATAPLIGIGPGTYEFWWAREGPLPGSIRDAHSLFVETLGELGVIGLALIAAAIGSVLIIGARRSLKAGPERRAMLAAATAGAAAFTVAAATDWVWEVAVLPVAFLLLAAAILGPEPGNVRGRPSRRARPALVGVVVVVAIGAVVAIGIPMLASTKIEQSQESVRAGDLDQALESARDARGLQPYAATPKLQEAQVLELRDELAQAAAAARGATEAEATNWKTWLILSRIQAKREHTSSSIGALQHARELNPSSPLFNQ